MKTREKSLWRWLRTGTRGLDDLHMERVENSLGLSYPDVDGCLGWRAFKLELKTTDRPARKNTPIRFKFQPGQVEWLQRRWEVGGKAWVLAQVGSGSAARRYLIRGSDAAAVASGIPELALGSLSVVPFDATAARIVEGAVRSS